MRVSVGSIRAVSAGSFTTGLFGSSSGSTVAITRAAAICVAMRSIRSSVSRRISGSKVRTVPTSSTVSGMMLKRTPPLIEPTDTTTGARVMSVCRATIVCRPSTICDAVTIGSTPCQGRPPCADRRSPRCGSGPSRP